MEDLIALSGHRLCLTKLFDLTLMVVKKLSGDLAGIPPMCDLLLQLGRDGSHGIHMGIYIQDRHVVSQEELRSACAKELTQIVELGPSLEMTLCLHRTQLLGSGTPTLCILKVLLQILTEARNPATLTVDLAAQLGKCFFQGALRLLQCVAALLRGLEGPAQSQWLMILGLETACQRRRRNGANVGMVRHSGDLGL